MSSPRNLLQGPTLAGGGRFPCPGTIYSPSDTGVNQRAFIETFGSDVVP
ncbi:MAG: hypothetical protein ACJASC_003378 [Limimaricola cinnabarinus]